MDEGNVNLKKYKPPEKPAWQVVRMSTRIEVIKKISLRIEADEFSIWWGDGSRDGETVHEYATKGVYCIRLQGRNIRLLDVCDCYLERLNVEQAVDLEMLFCSVNWLPSLQLKGLSRLKVLECYCNELKRLDLRGNPELLIVNCRWNKLSVLYVYECMRLRELDCSRNKLKSLVPPDSISLLYVKCNDNELSSKELHSFGFRLPERGCFWYRFAHMEIRNNPGCERFYGGHMGWYLDDIKQSGKDLFY